MTPAATPTASAVGARGRKSAVRAILANPRYTGHQVWNKQRRDEVLVDVEDVGLGHESKMRWNDKSQWVWSEQPVHEALVDIETFEAAQAIFGTRGASQTPRAPAEGRHYLLHGKIRCALCGRRMTGQWNHGRAYYRCRFTDDYGVDAATHPTTIYVKEDAVVPGLDRWLAGIFDDEHIDHTSDVLADAAEPDPEWEARQAELEAKIRDCDRRLAKYHKALDLTDEVEPFIEWIAEVKRERRQIEAQLGRSIPGEKLTKEQIRALIRELRNVVRVLADADPADKAELYAEMGVSLTYHPDGRVAVEALPRVRDVSVEGPNPLESIRRSVFFQVVAELADVVTATHPLSTLSHHAGHGHGVALSTGRTDGKEVVALEGGRHATLPTQLVDRVETVLAGTGVADLVDGLFWRPLQHSVIRAGIGVHHDDEVGSRGIASIGGRPEVVRDPGSSHRLNHRDIGRASCFMLLVEGGRGEAGQQLLHLDARLVGPRPVTLGQHQRTDRREVVHPPHAVAARLCPVFRGHSRLLQLLLQLSRYAIAQIHRAHALS